MKTLTRAALVLALLALGAAGCGRHPAPTAQKAARRADTAVVAVKPESAPAASAERATDMTEESEGATEIPAGLSPIAAAVAANTPAVAAPIPARWVEGKNYNKLVPAQPTTVGPDKVEVVEVFWYGCGHCNHLDPVLEAWRQSTDPKQVHRAPYVSFVRVPVMWNEVTRAHARLFYTMEALGKLDELHPLVFQEIHLNGNYLVDADPAKTEALQKAFLLKHGVTAAQFDATYHSFSVDGKLAQAEDLKRRYGAASVPLLVINGKYTAQLEAEGRELDFMQMINDLAASEHRH